MKAARSLLLLVLVLGLGAYIYWLDADKASTPEREAAQRRAFSLDLDRLTSVHIRRPEFSLELRREGEDWVLSSPEGILANQAAVRQTLSRLRALSRGELITPSDMRERGQTLADFGLAVPVAVLTLEDPRGARRYRIGNPNPLGNALYVIEESSQNVMLISSDLMEILPTRADAFRDRRILVPPANAVRALSFHAPGRLVRLETRGEHWVLTEPFRFPAQQERIAVLLEQLTAARIERFLLQEEIRGEPFGRDEDLVTLRVHFTGGLPALELDIGNRVPGEPASRYARFAGQKGVFVVSEGLRSIALTELLALQKLRILPVHPDQISEFTVRTPGAPEPIQLTRANDGWSLLSPLSGRASTEIAEQVLAVWTAAHIEERFPTETPGELLYRFELGLTGQPNGMPTGFDVLADASGREILWVKPDGIDELWRIFPDTLKYVPADPLMYLSRSVLRFPPAEAIRLRLRSPLEDITLTRADAASPWTFPDDRHPVDPGEIADLIDVLSRLQASRLLERGSVNLAGWNLEDAPFRLTVGLGGDRPDSRTLLFAPHHQWGMVGTIQGQDLVFALPESVQRLLDPARFIAEPSSEADADDAQPSDS